MGFQNFSVQKENQQLPTTTTVMSLNQMAFLTQSFKHFVEAVSQTCLFYMNEKTQPC